MNKQWIVVASVVAVVVAFIAGAVVFKGRETQEAEPGRPVEQRCAGQGKFARVW